MTEDVVFAGRVHTVDTSDDAVSVIAYDALQLLHGEDVPITEGDYSGDAGAIVKQIIANSTWSEVIDTGGIDTSTSVDVSSVNFTDKTRLEAIKILLYIVNGSDQNVTYHVYAVGMSVIFAPLPSYVGDNVACRFAEDGDYKPTSVKVRDDGGLYFNCATVIGAEGIRAYYPAKTDELGNMVPDFPQEAKHKRIQRSELQAISDCYQFARGYVRTHEVPPKVITLSFIPDRFDFFPGQQVEVDTPRYGVSSERFRIQDISASIDGTKKEMTFILASVETTKLTTYIN